MQDPKVAKNRHLGTIGQLRWAISLQLTQVSTIGKKLVKQQYLLHMSAQYGELRPTSGWDRFVSLGKPQVISTGFASWQRYCTTLLVVGVSQTLRRWTEGAAYIRQGGHHVGHWPTFLVATIFQSPYIWNAQINCTRSDLCSLVVNWHCIWPVGGLHGLS